MDIDTFRIRYEALFAHVEHPPRYIGREIHAVVKNDYDIHIALSFPDLYEIAMSNLGLQILYTALNDVEGVYAERVYAPARDMETLLREQSLPLPSLETYTPLKMFDMIGFTLQHELLYTNILTILSLGTIPLRANERNDKDPIIIAGGPCAVNPLPLANSIDLFLIGEFDSEIQSFIAAYRECKTTGCSREETLLNLAELPYVYAPRFHDHNDKTRHVCRVFERNLDTAPYPTRPLIPLMKIVQDRAIVEISRGCTHNCRFCAAGMTYRPVRNRSPRRVVELVTALQNATGATDVNLASLSADDYPGIAPLIMHLQKMGKAKGFSLSLPSLRVDSFDREVAAKIAGFKKTGLTFALEAGTEHVRKMINKELDEEDILRIAKDVRGLGWNLIKIYGMIGFTKNAREEAESLIAFLRRLQNVVGRRMRINVSINTFVPKPHTPLERVAQLHYKEATAILDDVRNTFRRTNVYLKTNSPKMSFLEGVLARGDNAVGAALLRAHELGARFDAWEESFSLSLWERAFADVGINPANYLAQRQKDQPLPWDVIDIGVSKTFLAREHERFEEARITPDCRKGECNTCGFDRKNDCVAPSMDMTLPPLPDEEDTRSQAVEKVFIRFKKKGVMRFLGHFDVKRLLTNALIIAGEKIAFSKGYSPKPKFVFTDPLPFGIESEAEYLEYQSRAPVMLETTKARVNAILPKGLAITHAERMGSKEKRIGTLGTTYTFHVESETAKRVYEALCEQETIVAFSGKEPRYSVCEPEGNVLTLTLQRGKGHVGIKDVIAYLITNDLHLGRVVLKSIT